MRDASTLRWGGLAGATGSILLLVVFGIAPHTRRPARSRSGSVNA